MNESNELLAMRESLRIIITGTCNTIGCNGCGLDWEEDGIKHCSATYMQSKIDELECVKDENNPQT